jgi:hypothetical protein
LPPPQKNSRRLAKSASRHIYSLMRPEDLLLPNPVGDFP